MAVKEKILVVDDEPSIRKYLQTLLEVDGFDVETASSGKEAVRLVSEGERPDFIILDVLMPEMGGLDTLVFAGGIGEHAPEIRARCCAGLEFLGIQLDASRNGANDAVISADSSRATVRVMRTDEESMIVREVIRVLQLQH